MSAVFGWLADVDVLTEILVFAEWDWYKENEKGRGDGGSSASGSDDEDRADCTSLVVDDSAPDTHSLS